MRQRLLRREVQDEYTATLSWEMNEPVNQQVHSQWRRKPSSCEKGGGEIVLTIVCILYCALQTFGETLTRKDVTGNFAVHLLLTVSCEEKKFSLLIIVFWVQKECAFSRKEVTCMCICSLGCNDSLVSRRRNHHHLFSRCYVRRCSSGIASFMS